MVANRPAQHGIARFEGVEDRALRGRPLDAQAHFAVDLSEIAEMIREDDSDHDSVWTSTERTEGRSRTIAFQLSPESVDAYTCPPVVPK